MQMRNITPNQTWSMPNFCTIGMKIGRVIIIMLTWSRNRPRKMSMPIMQAMTTAIGQPWPVMICTSPSLAPENDSNCAKVVAPTMMNRIIPDTPAVPRSALSIASRVRAR